jgi:hypothetical protein
MRWLKSQKPPMPVGWSTESCGPATKPSRDVGRKV